MLGLSSFSTVPGYSAREFSHLWLRCIILLYLIKIFVPGSRGPSPGESRFLGDESSYKPSQPSRKKGKMSRDGAIRGLEILSFL